MGSGSGTQYEDTPYARLVREQLKPLIDTGRVTVDHNGAVRMTDAAIADMLRVRKEKDGAEEKAPLANP